MFDFEIEDNFTENMMVDNTMEDTVMSDEELKNLMDNLEDYE
jgi:hypothetical protein